MQRGVRQRPPHAALPDDLEFCCAGRPFAKSRELQGERLVLISLAATAAVPCWAGALTELMQASNQARDRVHHQLWSIPVDHVPAAARDH